MEHYNLGDLYHAHVNQCTTPQKVEQARHYYAKYQKKLTKRLNELESYYYMPIYADEDDEDDMEMEFLSQSHTLVTQYYRRLKQKLIGLAT